MGTDWIYEAMAGLLSAISVWLTARRNIWCFPLGIISVAIYAYLFYTPSVRLYADGGLQICYLVMLLIGWQRWSALSLAERNISSALTFEWWLALGLTIFAALSIGFFLDKLTDADFPYLDAALAASSILAQWMSNRRLFQAWWLWIIIDVVYIPLYIYKNLYLTSIIYTLYLVLAFIGLIEWKKLASPQK
ncbi:MAG: hypothetical protein RIQ89_2282 [Bacteroidota bacterium]|jgi:nicotinamide mononucleotide transporter